MKISEKACFKCHITKPITEFYVHPAMGDGRLNKCKECARRDAHTNYTANIAHYVEYERKRFKRPERKRKAMEYVQHRPLYKRRANQMVSNAIRCGVLKRVPCEVCGNEKSEAHHDDYTKPLEVRWLCRKHHLEHHGKKSHVA